MKQETKLKIEKFLKMKNPSEKVLDFILKILNKCSNLYYETGNSPLTDEEYDQIYNKYKKYRGDILSIDTSSEGKRNKNLINTEHLFPQLVGTLDKANYVFIKDKEEANNLNVNTVEELINQMYENGNLKKNQKFDYFISWKIDGNSITIVWNDKKEVELALTRGKNGMGSDKTNYFKNRLLPKDVKIPPNCKIGIKFEAVVSFENKKLIEEKLKREYASPCSLVAGLLSKNDIDQSIIDMIDLVPIRVQYSSKELKRDEELKIIKKLSEDKIFGNISISPSLNKFDKFDITIYNEDYKSILKRIQDIYEKYSSYREKLPFPVDGIVIEIVTESIRKQLGRITDRNKFELALKFPYDSKKSKVKDIEFYVSTNGTGRITPVVIFEDVKFSRAVCNHVSIANYDRFKKLKLAKGDEVTISYHNDVLAYLTRDENLEHVGEPIKFIKECPKCGQKLKINKTKTFVFCNNKKCPSLIIGNVNNYLIKLGIDNIRENIIEDLYNAGLVNNIPDLYSLTSEEIEKIEGYQKISAKNIIKEINSKKDVYDYELLGSLGFKNISLNTCKLINKKYTIKEIENICNDDFDELSLHLIEIDGIADITAKQFEKDFKNNLNTIKKLSSILNVKEVKNEIKVSQEPKNIVFTGFRDADLQQKLELSGHSVKSGVSKKVDILVAATKGSNSGKEQKAKEYGINIYDLKEFKEKILPTLI